MRHEDLHRRLSYIALLAGVIGIASMLMTWSRAKSIDSGGCLVATGCNDDLPYWLTKKKG